MTKNIVFVAFVAVCIVVIAAKLCIGADFGEQHSVSSYKFSDATKQVYDKACYLRKVTMITDGSNDATSIVYDTTGGAAVSSKIVFDREVAGASDGYSENFRDLKMDGIYVEQGGNTETIVEYVK